MHLRQWQIWLGFLGVIPWLVESYSTALAMETPTPTPLTATPTPMDTQFVLPPGDTMILVVGAVVLVLIVLVAAIWSSRRSV